MARSIFSRLKKYASSETSKDENYTTETLATLLSELPNYRRYLMEKLFRIHISDSALVKTQEHYQTNKFGSAILDLLVEDDDNFVIIEVKIGAGGLNIYESQDEMDEDIYDQLQKYEDCIGLPENKMISVFTLTQHMPKIESAKYHYYNCDSGNIRWHELYRTTRDYSLSLEEDKPESYLLEHYIQFLKEENMAGFQGFTLQNLTDMSRLTELSDTLDSHRELIKAIIKIKGFKGSDENMMWDRDGIFYKWSGVGKVGVFVGLWYSDKIYHFKFPQESGPGAMVFLEIPTQHPIRKQILDSETFKKACKMFDHKNIGYQVLLKSQPLVDFLGQKDQAGALLSFYQEKVDELRNSGILDQILLWKPE